MLVFQVVRVPVMVVLLVLLSQIVKVWYLVFVSLTMRVINLVEATYLVVVLAAWALVVAWCDADPLIPVTELPLSPSRPPLFKYASALAVPIISASIRITMTIRKGSLLR